MSSAPINDVAYEIEKQGNDHCVLVVSFTSEMRVIVGSMNREAGKWTGDCRSEKIEGLFDSPEDAGKAIFAYWKDGFHTPLSERFEATTKGGYPIYFVHETPGGITAITAREVVENGVEVTREVRSLWRGGRCIGAPEIDRGVRNDAWDLVLKPGADLGVSHIEPASVSDVESFRLWIQGSKALGVDERPQMVMHGTWTKPFARFSGPHSSWVGPGYEGIQECHLMYFVDNRKVARSYGSNVVEAYLSLHHPLELDAEGATWGNFHPQGKIYTAAYRGCDGIIIRNLRDDSRGLGEPSTVFMVFDPDSILITSPELKAEIDAEWGVSRKRARRRSP